MDYDETFRHPATAHHPREGLRRVSLDEELHELWEELPKATSGHTARTLLRQTRLRLVLIAMKQGASLPAHHVDGEAAVQVISGKVAIESPDQRVELGPGEVFGAASGEDPRMVALQPSAVLLTICFLR